MVTDSTAKKPSKQKHLRIYLDRDDVRGLSAREFRDFLYGMGDKPRSRHKKSRRSPRG